MKITALHRWPRDTRAAIRLQRRLAGSVRLEPVTGRVRLVGGADAAFSADGADVVAGVVVWDIRAGGVVEQHVARRPCRFPYVPGLLSFRELPAVLAAFRKVRSKLDAVLCDGQGLAHPRKIGLACHLGLWLGLPTVGCAKSRLCGEYNEPGVARASRTKLSLDGDQVGCVLRSRAGVKPLFISPGHLCDHAGAVRLTLAATTQYRLPEPTRLAHQLVSRARRSLCADGARM